MKRGLIFSFTFDMVMLIIATILLWLVIGLSVDHVAESKEHSTTMALSNYKVASDSIVKIMDLDNDNIFVYECDMKDSGSVKRIKVENGKYVYDDLPGQSCPYGLYGIVYSGKTRGVR